MASTQTRAGPDSAEPASTVDSLAPPGSPLEQLRGLLDAPEDAPAAAEVDTDQLGRALVAVGKAKGSREAADFLQTLLATKELDGFETSSGHSLRALAVEALIGLGYPYALEVLPEDLAFARGPQRRGWMHRPLPAWRTLSLVASSLWPSVVLFAAQGLPVAPGTLAQAAVGLAGTLLATVSAPRSRLRAFGVFLLGAYGLVSLLGTLELPFLVVPALAALWAAAMSLPPRRWAKRKRRRGVKDNP